jgi:Rps23 Pro-64 3,4-dihydroxylase Tpa1-like proline 4-hydroxylase
MNEHFQEEFNEAVNIETNVNTNINTNININTNKKEIINYSFHTDNLSEIFKINKKIKIDNILDELFAETLYKYCMINKDWILSTGINKNKFEKKDIAQFANANQLQIKNVQNAFKEDQFSYAFYRNMNNQKCSYLEFLIRRELSSQIFIDYLNKITGLNLTILKTLFLSKYKAGNFLSPHSDHGNGRVAFVINLTKFWKPQYGGNLHFLNEDRSEIIDTYVPGFNNLMLFEVPENSGIPHYVSHIVPNVKYNRFAITGWFE